MFNDLAEVDGISSKLMVVWSSIIYKSFKIGIEGSLKARVEEDTRRLIIL
jgi:hypothetical protein